MPTSNQTSIKEKSKLAHPKKYNVYILNDNYTPMDFVIDILMRIFHKSYEQAKQTMLEVHQKDRGLCGIYSHEIAQTKVKQVISDAKNSGFPLAAKMEQK